MFAFKRYEGEWLQNNMEGHGVVEVDVPDIEPVPGSKYDYGSSLYRLPCYNSDNILCGIYKPNCLSSNFTDLKQRCVLKEK